jgi:hypothetical protein
VLDVEVCLHSLMAIVDLRQSLYKFYQFYLIFYNFSSLPLLRKDSYPCLKAILPTCSLYRTCACSEITNATGKYGPYTDSQVKHISRYSHRWVLVCYTACLRSSLLLNHLFSEYMNIPNPFSISGNCYSRLDVTAI